jgi:hypothetical protein
MSTPRLQRLVGLCLAAVLGASLVGCAAPSGTQKLGDGHAEAQAQRISQSLDDLAGLERVDLLLDFDSQRLARELRTDLAEALPAVPGWTGSDVAVSFGPGYVALDFQGRYEATSDVPIPVQVSGELVPALHPDRLVWRIELSSLVTDQLVLDPRAVLDRLQNALAMALADQNGGAMPLDALPLGILEAGIRLRAPFEVVRSESRALAGVVIPERVASLVDTDRTRLALQLGFVPELPYCEPTVSIGRATFAGTIANREPVQPLETQARPGEARVFFSEITNARETTKVVHYWFADGRPVAVTPLGVQPSARWRTWSGAPPDVGNVSRWQVLVLEERTGCILAHEALEVAGAPAASSGASSAGFDELAKRFRGRTSALATEFEPGLPAVASADRQFLGAALAEGMYDLSLAARIPVTRQEPLRVDVRIGAQPGDALSCSRPSCESQRVCTLDFERCPVQRDTRDCSSCLLRNPLNNRCVRESEDPICLAARDSENQRLATERQACIDRETAQRDQCVQERDRLLQNCRRQQSRQSSVCEAQVAEMNQRFEGMQPLASLTGNLGLSGTLDFVFSEFRMDPDLERIRMSISLAGDLDHRGALEFAPAPGLQALNRCIGGREEAYEAPMSLAPWRGGIVTDLRVEQSRLVADWSGLSQRLDASPRPSNQLLVSGAPILFTCPTGLDPARLLDNISGSGSNWLQGIFELDMRPEPTRITLLPAYLAIGSESWTGDAEVGAERVLYRIGNRD